ncbi:MAG: Geranyltranstransferase [Crocinitomicaceae bacterium]|jgi:geranylgeranyl diphosphate synthase type II|nr:Geranyltranstransferase [Crocinitomicaceae bacterium]
MESELKELASRLEQEISGLNLPSNPENLYQPLRYFLSLGGKRIRPILSILGADLFGAGYEKSKSAALAVELFHNFSLIHDDIMDEAPLRRSQKTVHTKWNSNIAILSGDVLLIKAYQQLCLQENRHIPELMRVFNQMAVEVCEGQQLDMDFENRSIAIDEYIEMIRLKTSVLLGCALEMGAIIADAEDESRKLLYEFGVNLGIAFQIQDDLLDLYADAEKFGKQVGGDIIANKKTILVLKAYALANPLQKEFLANLSQITDPQQKVEQTIGIFAELGIKEEVKKLRDSYFRKALEALDQINVPDQNKQKLRSLAAFLEDREV